MSKPKKDLSVDIPDELIKELLTESEVRMVKQRIAIMQLLQEGLSIRTIAKRVSVGTDTVTRTARKLKESPRLKAVFNKASKPKLNTSKWVFGQVGVKEE